MKAAVISLGSTSSKWTADEMGKYFEEVDMLDLKMVEARFGEKDFLSYKGKPLSKYDCILPKGSFRYATLLRLIAEAFDGKAYVPVTPESFAIAHNKVLTHMVLQKADIPMPRTYVSPTVDAAKLILKNLNYPIIMKFQEGTHGKGVMFAESYSSASSMLDALGALNQPFLIQEFIDTGGTDIRAFVVGGEVVASMQRKAKADEKRANLHAGGESRPFEMDRISKKLAVDTAKAAGMDICGVDLLQGPKGPLVLEVNISPGLQGITKISKVNVAEKIAKHLYTATSEFLAKSKPPSAGDLLKETKTNNKKEIITNLSFRGDRIFLPEVITKLTRFNERDNYTMKAERGKLVIEEFKI